MKYKSKSRDGGSVFPPWEEQEMQEKKATFAFSSLPAYRAGMWGWSGGVFSPPRVRDAAAKMNVGCWLWQYPSKVEAQPRAGHAVTVKNQKLSFRSAYPLPPTHVPPKTCIITMIFSSVSACKQIAGWEINTIVWSGIALFLERLDNKYFRLAGHIVSAAIIQHCHVTQKQPGTT